MNINDWRTAPPEAREAWVAEVTAQHPELRRLGSSGELAVPVFAHEPTDALLILVPGGSVTLGMTEEEHERAREAANIEEERWFVDKYAAAGTLQVTLKTVPDRPPPARSKPTGPPESRRRSRCLCGLLQPRACGCTGAPADGTPRPGPLPRVVRGGSACCYPWHECAEWTLMLCAARGDGEDMRGFWVIRPVLAM